jgi:integrase
VAVYLEQWLETYARPQVATKTYTRYAEISRRHLIPALGRLKLTKLQPLHIEEYYAKALRDGRLNGKGGLSPLTVRHHHRVLAGALGKAVRLKLLNRIPCESVDPPKPEHREAQALSQPESVALIEAANGSRLYLPIVLAVTTGLRRGELLGLKWEDITGSTLAVRRKIEQTRLEGVQIRKPKTKKSTRTIALPAFVLELLKRHETEQKKTRLMMGPAFDDQGFILCEADGSVWHPDSLTQSFRRFVRESGLRQITFHELRYSHATQLLKEGIHPKIVSERLGHATVAITMDTYSHVLEGMQEETADRLDKAYAPLLKK